MSSSKPGNNYVYYNDTHGHYNNVQDIHCNDRQLRMILKVGDIDNSWSGFSSSYCVGNSIIESGDRYFKCVYYNPNIFKNIRTITTGADVTAKYPIAYNSSAMGWFDTNKYTENYASDADDEAGLAYSYIFMNGRVVLTGATTSSLLWIENTNNTASQTSKYFTVISTWNGPDIVQTSSTASVGAGTPVFLCTVKFKPRTGNTWFDNNSSLYCSFDLYMYMGKYYEQYTDGNHYSVRLNYYYTNLQNQWLMGQADWGIPPQEFSLRILRGSLLFTRTLPWDSYESPNL